MLDQMFTAENFWRIYDSENRKGLDLAGRCFPDLEPHALAVREKVQEIRALRSKEASLGAEDFNAQLAALKASLAILKTAKSAAVDEAMHAQLLVSAAGTADWLRNFTGEPMALLKALRFELVGKDPLTGEDPERC